MKPELKKLLMCVAVGIAATTAISFWLEAHRNEDAARELENARQTLREQGFKTDYTDFNFTTDTNTQARMAALAGHDRSMLYDRVIVELDLMPVISQDTAAVLGRQDWLQGVTAPIEWTALRSFLNTNRDALDIACSAALSGPIRFQPKVSDHMNMWGTNAEQLRWLVPTLSVRAILESHDGDVNAVLTNLMAVTHITTAWEPAPDVAAHFLQLQFVSMAFAVTWQVLHCGVWTDARLASLQREWESASFLAGLPEVVAFDRLFFVDYSREVGVEPLASDFSFSVLLKEAFDNPAQARSDVKDAFNLVSYRGNEQLKDEKNLLLYFRDREQELRHAIQLPNWVAMRAQPGVTNVPVFNTWYLPIRGSATSEAGGEKLVLAAAVDAEARRRVIVTAIALERYHLKHGAYPAILSSLSPEFLSPVPVDFINSQPLHYRLTEDGRFVLYSVGLDCLDDGGKMPVIKTTTYPAYSMRLLLAKTNVDIVWPRPDPGTQTK